MSSGSRPRARSRPSFEQLADAVGASDVSVAPDDTDARRRDAPDPTLTDGEHLSFTLSKSAFKSR